MGSIIKNYVIYLSDFFGPIEDVSRLAFHFEKKGYTFHSFSYSNYGTIQQDVVALREFINTKKIYKPIIIGFGYGSMVAMEYALKSSKKISKLILLQASAFLNMSDKRHGIAEFFLFLHSWYPLKKFVQNFMDTEYEINWSKKNSALFSRLLQSPQRDLWIERFFSLLRFERLSDISKIQVETLLLAGKESSWISSQHSEALYNRIIKSDLVIFPDYKHFFLASHGDYVAYIIEKWLEGKIGNEKLFRKRIS